MNFRKKPVVIQAIQFDGHNFKEIQEFSYLKVDGSHGKQLGIYTLEGLMQASPGDWIIKGVAGEVYPCKPDIFEQTYEAVD